MYCVVFILILIVLYLVFYGRELYIEIFEVIKIIMRFKELFVLKIYFDEVICDENFLLKFL